MRRMLARILATTLAAPSMAQGFTSPPGYISTEGGAWGNVSASNGYSHVFGFHTTQHYQQIDREIKAGGAAVLTQVGYRLDYHNHSSNSAMGRSFQVTLQMSDGNLDTASPTFTSNQTSTPTTVSCGSVSWPSQVGLPATQPAPWDPALSFPFGTGGTSISHVYTGVSDLCLDYVFRGGTLANGISWSGSIGRTYYLDGLFLITSVQYGRNVFRNISNTTGNCTDSTSTQGYASGSIQIGLYGKAYTANPTWAGKAVLELFGSNTAPNSNVIHAVGLGGSVPGVAVPTFGCYNLMIDTTLMVGVYNIATNSTGNRPALYVPIADLSVLAPLGRSPIWSQAIWSDSVTG